MVGDTLRGGAQPSMVSLMEAISQKVCGLTGHDDIAHFQGERMFLKCQSCGRESAGWELNQAPPRRVK